MDGLNCKLIKILVVIGLSLPNISLAQVYINEILYSPLSNQWIEVYNNSTQTVDLSGYKVLDGGAAVNGHGITLCSSTVPPQGYALIAKNPDAFSGASYPVCKSSLGIKSTGDTVTLKSGTSIIDTVFLSDGSAIGGDSFQLQNGGNWIASSPTPGSLNSSVSTTTNNGQSTTTATSTETTTTSSDAPSAHASYVSIYSYSPTEPLRISAGRNRLSVVDIPIEFQAQANIDDYNISYIWTFGDGSRGEGKNIWHGYEYPGEYIVVVNASSGQGPAVGRTEVKVIKPDLEIREANPEYISIQNNSKDEINLYGWRLYDGEKKFEFPQDTIIKPGSSVIFPANITGLKPVLLTEVRLATIKYDIGSENVLEEKVPEVSNEESVSLSDMYAETVEMQKELADIKRSKSEQIPLPSEFVGKDSQEPVDMAKENPNESMGPSANLANTGSALIVSSTTRSQVSSWLDIIREFFLK